MATKKQRRRREKGRRHEYEIVYVDSEGQEVDVEEPEEKPREERKPTTGIKPTAATKSKQPAAKTGSRADRVVDPPSWDRTLKRAAIFVPIMLIFLYVTRPKSASTQAIVFQALVIIVLLIGFMYMMDTLLYRAYQKRQAKKAGGSPPKTK